MTIHEARSRRRTSWKIWWRQGISAISGVDHGAAGGIGRATALVAAQAGVGLVLVTANPMLSTNRSGVADVVAFLLSADARCVTGVAPPADAGVLATLG